ncbi:electron transfer flavoprotein subunit alpha/FixB family protein [Actinoplanes sp. NPDC051861]|uniref:electron transfer flavoprotein subunit alpha/FixB family protein n=1 Tax=Actinoplanes sp. NPDC051861 TaxID=3155170 RepID=UPI00342345C3
MRQVLVLAEGTTGTRRATCALLTVARRLGAPAVVLGGPADPAGTALLGRFGAKTIYPMPAPGPGGQSAAARVEMLVELARRTSPAAILIASGRDGLEIAGRVGVRLDSGVLSDVVDVLDGPVAVQSVRGGSYLVRSRVVRGVPVLAVRTEHITVVPDPATPAVRQVRVAFPAGVYAVRTVRPRTGRTSASPELSTAAVVVTGGRGVGSRAAFDLVNRLAEALGGAAGGSHTATELGWCPRKALVDQVGTIVHPSLYLALGVSGSQRHCAGMRGAATIVAIDSDPAAPIFRLSDLGVVGDVHQVVPELLAEIERRRAQPVISTRTVTEA